MAQKNLPLAVAVEAGIAAVSGAATGEVARSAQDLTQSLHDTLWSWGVSEKKAESKLRFFKDGTYVINNDPPSAWNAVDGTTMTFANGAKLKFAADGTRFTGTTPNGLRMGKKLPPDQ